MSSGDAAARAKAQYALTGDATAFLGRLTLWTQLPEQAMREPGRVYQPSVYRTLVWAVQVTGLELYPSGISGGGAAPHHEMLIFIDARSGEEVFASTFR